MSENNSKKVFRRFFKIDCLLTMTFILTNSQMIIKTPTRLPVYYLATRTKVVSFFPNAVSIWKFKCLDLSYSNLRLISTNACKFESISDKGNVIRNYSGKYVCKL